jgi:hypothetical protein
VVVPCAYVKNTLVSIGTVNTKKVQLHSEVRCSFQQRLPCVEEAMTERLLTVYTSI